MSPKTINHEAVKIFLKQNNVGTLDQIKEVLRTNSTMTAFRKLKLLNYLSSYSHKGKYYALNSIADFDESGLWSFDSIWFSKHGNLIETSKIFVDESETGFSANDLSSILHVDAKHALLNNFKQGRIHREKISNTFIYFSLFPEKKRQQIAMRKSEASHLAMLDAHYEIDAFHHELKAAIILFYSLLDEKQRRLFAGLESFKLGHGGDTKIADLLGLSLYTVAKGRKELLGGSVSTQRVRKKGGGRKTVEKKFQK